MTSFGDRSSESPGRFVAAPIHVTGSFDTIPTGGAYDTGAGGRRTRSILGPDRIVSRARPRIMEGYRRDDPVTIGDSKENRISLFLTRRTGDAPFNWLSTSERESSFPRGRATSLLRLPEHNNVVSHSPSVAKELPNTTYIGSPCGVSRQLRLVRSRRQSDRRQSPHEDKPSRTDQRRCQEAWKVAS